MGLGPVVLLYWSTDVLGYDFVIVQTFDLENTESPTGRPGSLMIDMAATTA